MSKNLVSNFKVGKYLLLGKNYLEFMKYLPIKAGTNLTDLYVVFMFHLEDGSECVKSFKDKTHAQVVIILDDVVAKLADMPLDMKQQMIDNYKEYGMI
jgi:hypothetical protein